MATASGSLRRPLEDQGSVPRLCREAEAPKFCGTSDFAWCRSEGAKRHHTDRHLKIEGVFLVSLSSRGRGSQLQKLEVNSPLYLRGSQLAEKFEALMVFDPSVLKPSFMPMVEEYLDWRWGPPCIVDVLMVSLYDGGGTLGGKNFCVGVDG